MKPAKALKLLQQQDSLFETKVVEVLLEIFRDVKNKPADRLAAAEVLFERAYGKKAVR